MLLLLVICLPFCRSESRTTFARHEMKWVGNRSCPFTTFKDVLRFPGASDVRPAHNKGDLPLLTPVVVEMIVPGSLVRFAQILLE